MAPWSFPKEHLPLISSFSVFQEGMARPHCLPQEPALTSPDASSYCSTQSSEGTGINCTMFLHQPQGIIPWLCGKPYPQQQTQQLLPLRNGVSPGHTEGKLSGILTVSRSLPCIRTCRKMTSISRKCLPPNNTSTRYTALLEAHLSGLWPAVYLISPCFSHCFSDLLGSL